MGDANERSATYEEVRRGKYSSFAEAGKGDGVTFKGIDATPIGVDKKVGQGTPENDTLIDDKQPR